MLYDIFWVCKLFFMFIFKGLNSLEKVKRYGVR